MNKEQIPERPSEIPKDLLSEQEALVHQAYAATKVEERDFTERASKEAYEEADRLVERLRSKNFDWLGIDWERFDAKELSQFGNLEERLDAAVHALAQGGRLDKSAMSIVDRLRHARLPLTVAAAILIGFAGSAKFKEMTSSHDPYGYMTKKFEMPTQEQIAKAKAGSEVPEFFRAYEMFHEWIASHPDVESVLLINAPAGASATESGDWSYHGEAQIFIRMKDGNGFTVIGKSGSDRETSPDASFPAIEGRALESITQFYVRVATVEAVEDALRRAVPLLEQFHNPPEPLK